jgi:hypothetical protein
MLATASMMDLKFVYMLGHENILMSYVFKDDGSEICVIWVTTIYTHDIFFKGHIKLYHTYLVFLANIPCFLANIPCFLANVLSEKKQRFQ